MWFQVTRCAHTPHTATREGFVPFPPGWPPPFLSPPAGMVCPMTTTTPGTWPVDWSRLPEITDTNRSQIQAAANAATGVLWALTGRRFGLEAVEARPCPHNRPSGIPLTPGPGWQPTLDSGAVRNAPTCVRTTCDRDGAVVLPCPVHRVTGFTVDGDDVALDSLVVDGDRVWRWGREPWPSQDLSRHSGEPGTWAIRYLRGTPPPAGAAQAAAALAKEFHAAATGGQCQLPRRTTSVQRQGVSVNMVDPTEIYESGATGLTDVDLWIRAANPHRQTQPAVVWSPDQEIW